MTRTAVLTMLTMLAVAGCNYPCNPDNCSDGCCDSDGVCLINGGNEACGLAAAACQRCDSEHTCSSEGLCVKRPHEMGESCVTSADCKLVTSPYNQLVCYAGHCKQCGGAGDDCEPGTCCSNPSGPSYACDSDNSKMCMLKPH